MTDTSEDPESVSANGGFKSLFTRWLFQQGTSTVLLFVIAAALWYGIPWYMGKVDTEMKEQRIDHKAERAEMRKDFIEELEKIQARAK